MKAAPRLEWCEGTCVEVFELIRMFKNLPLSAHAGNTPSHFRLPQRDGKQHPGNAFSLRAHQNISPETAAEKFLRAEPHMTRQLSSECVEAEPGCC